MRFDSKTSSLDIDGRRGQSLCDPRCFPECSCLVKRGGLSLAVEPVRHDGQRRHDLPRSSTSRATTATMINAYSRAPRAPGPSAASSSSTTCPAGTSSTARRRAASPSTATWRSAPTSTPASATARRTTRRPRRAPTAASPDDSVVGDCDGGGDVPARAGRTATARSASSAPARAAATPFLVREPDSKASTPCVDLWGGGVVAAGD